MRHEALRSYALTLDEVRRTVAGLGDEQMVRQFSNVPNHPAWTLGHLVHSAEAIGGEMGLLPWLPKDWGSRFGTGSIPRPEVGFNPTARELIERLNEAQARLERCVMNLPAGGLVEPLPDVRHRVALPTVGHAVIHILAGHTAFHLGQLSLWRRALSRSTGPPGEAAERCRSRTES